VSAQRDRALFYVLSRGSCYLEVDGLAAPVPLVGGDVAMLPHGAAHIVRDQVHTPAIPLEALLQAGCREPSAPGVPAWRRRGEIGVRGGVFPIRAARGEPVSGAAPPAHPHSR